MFLGLPVLVILTWTISTVFADYAKLIPNSFFFSWDGDVAVQFPVTEQCATINIKWSRGAARGPSPVAPYVLQVYSSAYIVPFIIPAGSGLSFNWQVPFAPGTLYQICMFDSAGNSGGCQAIYSVIAPSGSTTPPTCTNVTFPGLLNVAAQVSDGILSQYGWPSQCTDISVTPRNGTPPYTFTIAPTLHPPYNLTSNTMSAINWTIVLTWASPFFISVVDSVGNRWANGPLHSGAGASSDCLALTAGGPPPPKPFPKTTLASAIGSAIGGLILGGIITYFVILYRSRSGRRRGNYLAAPFIPPSGQVDPRHMPVAPSSSFTAHHVGPISPTSPNLLLDQQYQIEPFSIPATLPNNDINVPTQYQTPSVSNYTDGPSSPPGAFSDTASQAGSSRTRSSLTRPQNQQVYVVHHDGGQVPFSIYTQAGAMVEELPPNYPGDVQRTTGGSSTGPSDETIELEYRQRRPGSVPQKGAPSATFYTN